MDIDALASSWRNRFAAEESLLAGRAAAARRAAEAAARVLVDEFGATEVWLFGSLAAGGPRHPGFDIDLAVRGVPPERFFSALARISQQAEVPVDLVTLESCTAALRRRVHERGIPLHGT